MMFGFTANGQSIINDVIGSAGMHSMNAGGIQLSWTIGEPITETTSNPTWILTQGFHQSWQSQGTIGQSPYESSQLTVNVYPNPVRDGAGSRHSGKNPQSTSPVIAVKTAIQIRRLSGPFH